MKITSDAFSENGLIPSLYTCDGKNINPSLLFSAIPAETKTLALVVDDPDVPKEIKPDGVWDHWVVYNMPPNTTGIEANSLPIGEVGKNSSGQATYRGPCPPNGEHRYFFTLLALDAKIEASSPLSKAEFYTAAEGHIIAKAELVGRYSRE
ncbi:YbhB/YbcL family Raf kinase inhibitor-like protein [Candidatus Uhrbacteria bacterium CG10_big_fil_rev_8_21_14_0_10_48_11]|uniref:YbhB/YbcL family Raf kinase inhibitor-like protein n=1 Tax=Candidatus Uhrbacteria bacterium CG10_big_fil_rev_8_21_14_0_10_48_11 TaxID=1975037 RepID=A0A2M8LEU1_9BACT|nr:MAG: YbhB/YbcL family Raf kinase inhibitor-like protein [Candidatus Uhrbacteria bacterium CG10_big_fil_rev_8_21_14_0_10_48_11]